MLIAEVRGKSNPAIADDEDYLTSTVFSHLRYVSPGPFWNRLFARAKTLPIDGVEKSVFAALGRADDLKQFATLETHFWPSCAGLGQPELALVFRGEAPRPLVALVEVKLWAEKSGHGECDQLMRYLKIADNVSRLSVPLPVDADVIVIYLTPRESSAEVEASLDEYGDDERSRRRLFHLQWQDLVDAIDEALPQENDFNSTILNDVREFLRLRGLEYFAGFRRPPDLADFHAAAACFYSTTDSFRGFALVPELREMQIVRGAW